MKALEFSKTKRKRPLSHYKVTVSHIVPKSTFKDTNHIDTIKPGTLTGFIVRDDKGNVYSDIEDYFRTKYNKQEQSQNVEQTQNKDDNIM